MKKKSRSTRPVAKKSVRRSAKPAPSNSKFSNIGELRFLVTGGSGSLGSAVIKQLLARGARDIVSMSRHEKLVQQASADIVSPYVTFKLGDITDKASVDQMMDGVDVVFNMAAVKHVSLAETNPREAYRVNVVGLLNLLNASNKVSRFVHMSTDKAIGVMNCYGATKLLGEYLVRESNAIHKNSQFLIVRCPNLLGSRGSVIDVWKDDLKKKNQIRIRDPHMTRYFIAIEDAAKFVVNLALADAPSVETIYYPLAQTKKFKLGSLARAFVNLHGNRDSSIEVVGAMPGEKRHEDYIENVPLSSIDELSGILSRLT